MPDNYAELLILEYQKRKSKKILSSNLTALTPGGLKQECLNVYIEKKCPKEDPALRTFFGPLINDTDYADLIRNVDIDKFKPLINFLEGKTSKPSKKNLELLEWLLDKNIPLQTIVGDIQTIGKEQSFLRKNFHSTITTFIIATVVITGLYFIHKVTRPKYMYWSGDHYEQLDYNQKITGVPIIPLDHLKLAGLKKITVPDTITKNFIGKIWYVKVNPDSIEFYTSKGEYPMDTNKILKPVTRYIIDKYVTSP